MWDSTEQLRGLGESGARIVSQLPQLKQNYDIAKRLTEALNPERRLNVAFYVGNQNVEYDLSIGAVVPPMADSGHSVEPVIDNICRTLLDTRVSNFVSKVPQMEVVATSNQQSDLTDATMANSAAEAEWYHLTLSDVFSRGHQLAGLKYNAFVHPIWDWTAGRITPDGKAEGDVQVELVDPTEVFVDPMAQRVMPERTSPTDARWLFRLCVRDVAYLYSNANWKEKRVEKHTTGVDVIYGGLPEKAEDITGTDATLPTDDEISMAGAMGVDARKAAQGSSIHHDGKNDDVQGKVVKLLYYYEHKSEKYPRGRFAIFLPENQWHVLEYREELPFATADHPTGLFPWVMIDDRPVEGRLAGHCRLSEVRQLQTEINREMTHWRELRARVMPYILADEDSGVDPDTFGDSTIAKVVKYHSTALGKEPQLVFPAGISQEMQVAVNTITTLTRRAEDKMEAHSAAYHPHTASTTLGEIEIMKLEDVSRQSADIKRAETNVYAPTVKLILQLCQRYYTNERMIRYFGDKNKATVIKFRGTDLHFEDVMIVPGSSLQKSRALQVQLAIRFAQLRGFESPDPTEARQLRQDFADILTLNLTTEAMTDQLDKSNARDENLQMLDGQEPPVEWSDNHIIHLNEVMRLLKSADFRNLPEPTKGRVRDIAMRHYYLHKQMLEGDMETGPEAMGQVAEASAMAQGAQAQNQMQGQLLPDGRMLVPQEVGGSPNNGNRISPEAIPGEPGMGAELPESGEQ